MKTIVVSNMKGGVGKSTICINLAHAFNKDLKVCLLDVDAQKNTYQLTQGIDICIKKEDVPKDCDILVVDTPPYINENLVELYISADLVIVPMTTGYHDLPPTQRTLEILVSALEINKNLKALVVINQNDTRSQLGSEIEKIISESKIPVAKTKFVSRIAYKRSCIDVQGIYSSEDKKAIDEQNEFVQEVLFQLMA